MKTILLTIIGTTRSMDLELPAEVPVGSLLPTLVKLCAFERGVLIFSSQWSLWSTPTRAYLDPARSLLEADVVDGAQLHLRFLKARQEERPTFQPKTIQPSEESGGIGVRWNALR